MHHARSFGHTCILQHSTAYVTWRRRRVTGRVVCRVEDRMKGGDGTAVWALLHFTITRDECLRRRPVARSTHCCTRTPDTHRAHITLSRRDQSNTTPSLSRLLHTLRTLGGEENARIKHTARAARRLGWHDEGGSNQGDGARVCYRDRGIAPPTALAARQPVHPNRVRRGLHASSSLPLSPEGCC